MEVVLRRPGKDGQRKRRCRVQWNPPWLNNQRKAQPQPEQRSSPSCCPLSAASCHRWGLYYHRIAVFTGPTIRRCLHFAGAQLGGHRLHGLRPRESSLHLGQVPSPDALRQ